MWGPEAFVAAYAGLACLARGNHRFRSLDAARGAGAVPPALARAAGWLLLAVAAAAAFAGLGPAQGAVGLACALGLAGFALVFGLSVRPVLALAPSAPLLLFGRPPRRS